MTAAIVITVMAPGTHHHLRRDASGGRGAGSAEGVSCAFTTSVPCSSATCNRVRADAVRVDPATAVVRPYPVYVTGRTPDDGIGSAVRRHRVKQEGAQHCLRRAQHRLNFGPGPRTGRRTPPTGCRPAPRR